METADVGSSEDLFNAAMADAPPAEAPAAEAPAAEPGEQPRDEQGRFASKPEDTPAPAVATPSVAEVKPEERTENRIPLSEHLSVRERAQKAEREFEAEKARREDLERRFQALEQSRREPPKPEEKPDPLLDPQGFTEYMERKFEDRLLGERREMSLRMAHRTHKEAFTEAYAEAQAAMARGDRALAARMQSSSDPGETLIQWHHEQRTMREVGNDPNAWLEKKLEERLSDPAFLAKAVERARTGAAAAPANGAPAVRLPPSLSGAARADAHEGSGDPDPMSSESLFNHALR